MWCDMVHAMLREHALFLAVHPNHPVESHILHPTVTVRLSGFAGAGSVLLRAVYPLDVQRQSKPSGVSLGAQSMGNVRAAKRHLLRQSSPNLAGYNDTPASRKF